LLYLAIKNAGLRWRRSVEWTTAMSQLAIQFRHHGNVDDRLVRTFAVKLRVFDAPLRGLGA
jgi:hypothetical protein